MTTLEEDEAALKKGRSGTIVVVALLILTAFGALGFVLSHGNDGKVYVDLRGDVAKLDREHFDQLWGCALAGADLRNLKSDQNFRDELEKRARQSPKRYATLIRERCMPKYRDYSPMLVALLPPEDAKASVDKLQESVDKLRGALNDYVGYLERAEAYDHDEAESVVTPLARAWYDYKVSLRALQDLIASKTK